MNWTLSSPSHLSDKQFTLWSALLESRTGMRLLKHQRTHVEVQLAIRLRELDCQNYDAYYEKVSSGLIGAAEWAVLVDRLTVKETSFFRHQPSYAYLKTFLDELLARDALSDTVDVWSVGCSTGEESYSLAMTLQESFKHLGCMPYFSVTGSDVSGPALNHARQGIYGKTHLTGLSEKQKNDFFVEFDTKRLQVIEGLRSRVCFSRCNVLTMEGAPPVKMDVIYCQNMLIYFRRDRRKQILDSLVEQLKPGGLLIIGLGEVTDWKNPKVTAIAAPEVQAYRAGE